jgi:hypothetical protein
VSEKEILILKKIEKRINILKKKNITKKKKEILEYI